MGYNDEMPMSQYDVEQYRLAQYLRAQQMQQAQTDTSTGLAKSAGNLTGTYAGKYAGNEIVGALGGSTPVQGQLTSEGISAITGGNGLYTPVAQNMSVGTSTVGTEAAGTTGMADLAGIGSAGNVILPAAGALGAYDLYANRLKTGDKKRGAAQGAASGAAMGSYFGPWGAVIGGALGLGVGLTAHESTRDSAKRKTGSLMKQGKDNPAWQAYLQGMRKQYEKAPTGPAFAGKYNTFDEYKKAGLESGDLTGIHGNLKTFGPDWAGYGMDRQKQIVQALIDADLYHSKKGEVEISDAIKAKALRDQILKTALPVAAKNVSQPSVVVAPSANLGSTAPIVTYTEGVNGSRIPVFAPSPATLAKYEAINKAKGIVA